jgi:gliding motility-associated-like protein
MSNQHNIDKLLKESFENFTPDAPNVWEAVKQGVQAAQATGAASGATTVAAVKGGVGLTIKIIAGIAIAATAVTSYVLFTAKPEAKTKQTTTEQAINVEPKTENVPQAAMESNSVAQIETSKPVDGKITSSTTNKVASAKTTSTKPIVAQGSISREPVEVTKPVILATEPQNNNVPQISGVKETKPTTVIPNPKKDNGPVVTETKKEEKRNTPPPTNPNAEEGEIYDRPVIPGAFSPDNNGFNDRFVIVIDNETDYSLVIVDGNRNLVFESKNKQQTWDGTNSKTGIKCPAGEYIYFFTYQFKGSDKQHNKTGKIWLFE